MTCNEIGIVSAPTCEFAGRGLTVAGSFEFGCLKSIGGGMRAEPAHLGQGKPFAVRRELRLERF